VATATVTATVAATETVVATATVAATGTVPAAATVMPTDSATVTSTTTATAPVSATNSPTTTSTDSPTPVLTDRATPAPTATPRTVVSSADFALLPTLSGLDARVTLHGPGDAGPFTFSLALDPRAALEQETDGTIRVTRPITTYADDGSPRVTIQTEYVLPGPTVLDSSPDPAAVVRTGPATMTLTTAPNGRQAVAVAVDPAWLGDPRRAFPVTVDLPVVTAYAAIHSGVIGTLSSCAPRQEAVQTALLVGREGGCTYHGQASFDTTYLPAGAPVHAARLWLYTPDSRGAPGVLVYPNAVGTRDPAQPVSWDGAPALAAGAPGLAPDGSAGHWQSWDVTSLVQGWVRDNTTNGGLTLVGTGDGLARFTSPLGAGGGDPSQAPYLDVAFGNAGTGGATAASVAAAVPTPAPAPVPSGPFNPDGAASIYGLSGVYTPDLPASGHGYPASLSHNDPACYNSSRTVNNVPAPNINNVACTGGSIRISAVATKLHASFVRFNVKLACGDAIASTDLSGPSQGQTSRGPSLNPDAPSATWWNTSKVTPLTYVSGPHKGAPIYVSNGHFQVQMTRNNYLVAADTQDNGTLAEMLASVRRYGLIPIVNVTANGYCVHNSGPRNEGTPQRWYAQTLDLVKYIHDHTTFTTLGGQDPGMIYFEIGNEVNDTFGTGKRDPKTGALLPYQGSGSAYTSGRYVDSTEGPPIFHYEDVFAAAAHGLNDALSRYHYRAYRIVTAGMIAPTANLGRGPNKKPYCTGTFNQDEPPAAGVLAAQDNTANVFMAGQSINKARGAGRYQPTSNGPSVSSPAVATGHLAVAVHPYGYDTQAQTQWRNFYATESYASQPLHGGNGKTYGWAGPCEDLGDMHRTWTHAGTNTLAPGSESGPNGHRSRYDGVAYDFTQLPLLFTEYNYESGDLDNNKPPLQQMQHSNPTAEGAGIADLFTWIYNHRCLTSYQGRTCDAAQQIVPANSVLRVAVFKGADGTDNSLGIFTPTGGDKVLRLTTCATLSGKLGTQTTTVGKVYAALLNDRCYSYPTIGYSQ